MTDEAADHTMAIFAVHFSLVYIDFVPVTNVRQPAGLKTASFQRLNSRQQQISNLQYSMQTEVLGGGYDPQCHISGQ